MNIEKLYAHLTSQLSEKEIIMRFLQSSLIKYDKLKFSDIEGPNGKVVPDGVHPLIIIAYATMDMGWNFMVEKVDGDVRGLIIGTDEYVVKYNKTVEVSQN